jgi:hypothetical protein
MRDKRKRVTNDARNVSLDHPPSITPLFTMALRLVVLVVVYAPLLVNSMTLTQRSFRVSLRRGIWPTAARSLADARDGRASSLFL